MKIKMHTRLTGRLLIYNKMKQCAHQKCADASFQTTDRQLLYMQTMRKINRHLCWLFEASWR